MLENCINWTWSLSLTTFAVGVVYSFFCSVSFFIFTNLFVKGFTFSNTRPSPCGLHHGQNDPGDRKFAECDSGGYLQYGC